MNRITGIVIFIFVIILIGLLIYIYNRNKKREVDKADDIKYCSFVDGTFLPQGTTSQTDHRYRLFLGDDGDLKLIDTLLDKVVWKIGNDGYFFSSKIFSKK